MLAATYLRAFIFAIVATIVLAPAPASAQHDEFQIVDTATISQYPIVGWNWQYTAVRCADDRHCVCALNINTGSSAAAIRATSDGGSTWKTIFLRHRDTVVTGNESMNGVRIVDVAMPTSQLLIVLADSLPAKWDTSVTPPRFVEIPRPFLCRSTDGGATWRTEKIDSSIRELVRITMLDSLYGVMSTADRLYRTTDGGASWSGLPYPPVHTFSLGTVLPLSPALYRGFIYDTEQKSFVLIESRDSGSTWTAEPVTEGDDASWISFRSADIGWRATWEATSDPLWRKCYLKKTTDGGRTWSTQFEELHHEPAGLNRVNFVNDNVGFAGGAGGEFLYTTDGGAHWSHYDSLYYYDIDGVGESPTILSIAPLNSTSALFGMVTSKLVRFSARPASVPVADEGSAPLRLYPNPASDRLRVSFPGTDRGDLRIVDILGRTICRAASLSRLSAGVDVDVASLPQGMYVVVVERNDGIFTAPFIKR